MGNLLDLSDYQRGISQAVINQPDVVIVKVTEGTNYTSPAWRDQADKALAAGKPLGLYHFATEGDSDAQADYFLSVAGGYLERPGVFPALDFEKATVVAYPAFAHDWLVRVGAKSTTTPVIYLGSGDIKRFGTAYDLLKKWPLWLAEYPYSTVQLGWGRLNEVSPDWAKDNAGGLNGWDWAAWQYTGTGRLEGYAGDLDLSETYHSNIWWSGLGSVKGPTTSKHGTENNTGTGWTLQLPFPEGTKITQNFGDNLTEYNKGAGHSGTDFAVPVGTDVHAVGDGTVLWADWAEKLPTTSWADRWYLTGGHFGGIDTSGGIVVVLHHEDSQGTEFLSVYAHNSSTNLNTGDAVTRGQVIAQSGATGTATGPHSHCEIIPLPANWSNGGYYGRVNLVDFVTTYNATHRTDEETEIMANIDDLIKRLDRIEKQQKIIWGGIFTEFSYSGKKGTEEPGIIPLLKANNRDTWRMKLWLYQLWSTWRVGIPGVVPDGRMAAAALSKLGVKRSEADKAGRDWYDAARKKGFEV